MTSFQKLISIQNQVWFYILYIFILMNSENYEYLRPTLETRV